MGTLTLARKLSPILGFLALQSIAVGIVLQNLLYVLVNFCAQEYTTLPLDEIHCNRDMSFDYCKKATRDCKLSVS